METTRGKSGLDVVAEMELWLDQKSMRGKQFTPISPKLDKEDAKIIVSSLVDDFGVKFAEDAMELVVERMVHKCSFDRMSPVIVHEQLEIAKGEEVTEKMVKVWPTGPVDALIRGLKKISDNLGMGCQTTI